MDRPRSRAAWLCGQEFALFPIEWAKSQVVPPKIRVLIAIVKHADADGIGFPSYKTISALTGLPNDRISKLVKTLVEDGLLERPKRGSFTKLDGTGNGDATVYRAIANPTPTRIAKPRGGTTEERKARAARKKAGEQLSLDATGGCQYVQQGVVNTCNGGVASTDPRVDHYEETIGIDQLIEEDARDTTSIVSLADNDSAQVADRVIEPESQLTACGLEVFSVLDDDGPHKRGSLHSHSSSAQQPHHVATNNTSDSYGDNTESDWSNGVDSHDDPSEYRTVEDTPRDSFKVIQGGRSLYDSLLNQQ